MLSYCLKCRKNIVSKNLRATKTKSGKPMPLLKFAVCGSKKSRFIKEQEASRLLLLLWPNLPLKDVPLLGATF